VLHVHETTGRLTPAASRRARIRAVFVLCPCPSPPLSPHPPGTGCGPLNCPSCASLFALARATRIFWAASQFSCLPVQVCGGTRREGGGRQDSTGHTKAAQTS
jgi:hypothetical protein